VLARFEEIRNKYFRRERLTIAISEPSGLDFAKQLANIVKTGGESVGASRILPLPSVNEGIAAPVTVSFASRAGNLNEIGEKLYTGAFALLTNIISFEILWNEIRLKKGAYDTGFSVRPNSGTVGCYSYRDPSPESSVTFFAEIKSEVDAFLESSPDLLKYMIGVIGSADTVSTPRNDGSNATKQYLAGRTYDELVRTRMECLDATVEELRRLSDIIGEVMKKSTFTVVGPRDTLEAMKDIDVILDI
jgi:Zn-dependent M16 (insulinase) family peptidase